MIFIRRIHSGYVKKVLNGNVVSISKRYEQNLGDQRERCDHGLSKTKYEKDRLTRELASAKSELLGLFSLREASQVLDSAREAAKSAVADGNEARRVYRLLRPNAQSFFEEQSSEYLKGRLNELLSIQGVDSTQIVAVSEGTTVGESVPVFTSNSYTISVTSILSSLCKDLRSVCEYLGIGELPEKGGNTHTKLFEKLESFFKLRRDGSNVDDWVGSVWARFRPLFIDELSEISNEEVSGWLREHLGRVSSNLEALNVDSDEWYDFSKDLLYDSVPFPEKVSIESKIGYPLDEASDYLTRVFSLFKDVKLENVEELIENLKALGLRDWFKLKPNEIEDKLLGTKEEVADTFEWTKEDCDLSYLLIETVARNMDHLLDIESYSPSSILSTISKDLKQNLFNAEENKWMTSAEIKEMINRICLNQNNGKDLSELIETPLKQMLMSDYEYSHQIGSVILPKKSESDRAVMSEGNDMKSSRNDGEGLSVNSGSGSRGDKRDENDEQKWKWVVPSVDSIFDSNRNMYIRNKSNLDPMMRLDNLKSCIVSKKRMRSMTKEGRVYFLRIIAAIGDGNGYFGMGIGYGNDVNSAKNSAIENGLKNMYFIDYNPFESLTTPVIGREYGSRCVIEGREYNSGIRANRKFLPLLYLIGLNNVSFKLKGTNSWVTRIRSIRRALESIMSRRTICNMLGKRYVEVSAPGDNTIHWSDEWFNPILDEYRSRINKLRSLRFRFSRRNRYKYNILLPTDVTKLVPDYSRGVVVKGLRPRPQSS